MWADSQKLTTIAYLCKLAKSDRSSVRLSERSPFLIHYPNLRLM
ncbi:MAG: hypothetical protein RMY62_004955 [Nostoc sp. ZfuVER08]|nr:hypothetical protein [Nostoc punctiforme]MDZ8013056.1 hypothetical protein [Nostoc sp. ZfuVER08]